MPFNDIISIEVSVDSNNHETIHGQSESAKHKHDAARILEMYEHKKRWGAVKFFTVILELKDKETTDAL